MSMNCDSGHPWPSPFGRATRVQFRSKRNCRKHLPGKGRTPEVLKDIVRITALWNDCRASFGRVGDFLFGRFSIADAMYAPVALRFVTYAVELDPVSAAYVQTIAAMPAIQQWVADARAETEVIPQFEPYA